MTDFGYFPAPPSGTLPPRSVNGVRVGHERTLVEAQQLLATVAAMPEPPRRVAHEARFLTFVLDAHGPDETGRLCRVCSTFEPIFPWPCAAVALLVSQLRAELDQDARKIE